MSDTNPPGDATPPEQVSERQMRLLNLLLSNAGLTERKAALEWISGVLGFEVTTRRDLTKAQASELIDRLNDGTDRVNRAGVAPQVPVQEAVRRVTHDIGQIGIGKGEWNEQQRYHFRGIDQFVNALSPIQAKHGVTLLPHTRLISMDQHPTRSGGTQFMVVLEVGWTIVGPMGDTLRAQTIGQAMDASDKAANKAMSAAFKYALGQVFAVPNIGWTDGDADHPEAAQRQQEPPGGPRPGATTPDAVDERAPLIDRIAALAAESNVTVDVFTAKYRQARGELTLDQFRQAPVSVLSAFVRQVEAWQAQQQSAQQAQQAEPDPRADGSRGEGDG